jgi:hypothetical protein
VEDIPCCASALRLRGILIRRRRVEQFEMPLCAMHLVEICDESSRIVRCFRL